MEAWRVKEENPLPSFRAEIRPCEDFLCSIDISGKRAKYGYLTVSEGILNVLEPAIQLIADL
jgi:hypothetical protein